MPKRRYEIMPPNGSVPNHLHMLGDLEEPKIPCKAFVFPAENLLGILKSLDGTRLLKQSGLPDDAMVMGVQVATALPNTIVIFVASASWALIPTTALPEMAPLHIEVVGEKVNPYDLREGTTTEWTEPFTWIRGARSTDVPE